MAGYAQGLHAAYSFVHQRDVRHAPVWTQHFLARTKELTGVAVVPPAIIPQVVQGGWF